MQTLRCWSAGCASGEEPFTLAMLFRFALLPRFPELKLELLATDADAPLLERARVGCYRPATLRELPEAWKRQGFLARDDGLLCVRPELRELVGFACADVRTSAPAGPLHLLLCRNVVFTYFDEAEQARAVERFADLIPPGGLLVLGAHEESFPPTTAFARPLPRAADLRAGLTTCAGRSSARGALRFTSSTSLHSPRAHRASAARSRLRTEVIAAS